MDIEQLKEQIRHTAAARRRLEVAKAVKQLAMAKWEFQNGDIIQEVNAASVKVTEVEAKLRELTLQVYAETGNKAPAPGVAVREITKLEYDPKDALEWAWSHQIALSLDKKSFEGFAKATPLDFVTVTQEPQATIATKLEID